jgi:NADH:ubiquinone oxidoreductase subunit 5 (subunit L)/multisubunit Na+/H+ antiporter MnhA subunit
MYLLIVWLPFISFIAAGLFGWYIKFYESAIITTSCLFLSFIISMFIFYKVALMNYFIYI